MSKEVESDFAEMNSGIKHDASDGPLLLGLQLANQNKNNNERNKGNVAAGGRAIPGTVCLSTSVVEIKPQALGTGKYPRVFLDLPREDMIAKVSLREQVSLWRRNGYLCISDVLSSNQINTLLNESR